MKSKRQKNSESATYKSGRSGADKRTKHDFVFKMRTIEQLDGGKSAADVVFDNGIDKSLVSKWNKDCKTIIDAAASKHRRFPKQNRSCNRHSKVFVQLYNKVSRSTGMKVSFANLYTRANKIQKSVNPDSKSIPKRAVTDFITKYKIKL